MYIFITETGKCYVDAHRSVILIIIGIKLESIVRPKYQRRIIQQLSWLSYFDTRSINVE